MFGGMQHSHYELKPYLKRKHAEHETEHEALVRNVAYQHLQRGQIGRPYFVIGAERC